MAGKNAGEDHQNGNDDEEFDEREGRRTATGTEASRDGL